MHLFEFLDQDWVPKGLRATLLEILETVNAFPFRAYRSWVTRQVILLAKREGLDHVVELGAGAAPLTKALARHPEAKGLRLTYCDHFPDGEAFRRLREALGEQVCPIFEPVDFSVHRSWPKGTLLVLSATFHHVPRDRRCDVIEALSESAQKVMIFEPLRKNLLSFLYVFLSLIPSLLLPVLRWDRQWLRRVLWCWVLPLAPVLFLWDGLVSVVRQWSELEWVTQIYRALGDRASPCIKRTLFSQMVVW